MLEVYDKRTFIEIDTNLRKSSEIFSNMVLKENAYYWENENNFSFILLCYSATLGVSSAI